MTERERSLELLNQLHQFPTTVLIKVIGTNHPTFVANVVAAVRIEVALEIDLQCTTRETPNGRHVAVSLGSGMSGSGRWAMSKRTAAPGPDGVRRRPRGA